MTPLSIVVSVLSVIVSVLSYCQLVVILVSVLSVIVSVLSFIWQQYGNTVSWLSVCIFYCHTIVRCVVSVLPDTFQCCQSIVSLLSVHCH